MENMHSFQSFIHESSQFHIKFYGTYPEMFILYDHDTKVGGKTQEEQHRRHIDETWGQLGSEIHVVAWICFKHISFH